MLVFLLFVSVTGQPFYKDTLRQLPNKLKQERIHATVQQEVGMIEKHIIRDASLNHTFLNFTLFCTDPNRQYREQELRNHMNNIPQGARIPHYGVHDSYMPGQYMYQRDGMGYRFSINGEGEQKTEILWPRPPCHPKYGYELYQRIHPKLEDTPHAYVTLFFQKLKIIFPDLHLNVTNKRPSEGLYDTDCCPLFTVSWY